MLGPAGLSQFEELSRREGVQTAILYAFDLIGYGHDAHLINEHIAKDGPIVFAHACRLTPKGIVSKKIDGTYRSGPCRVSIKVRNPASIALQRERGEIWNR